MPICERCGTNSPAGFRFCGGCGAPLPAASAPRETRKVVTVLFSDATGWTALGEQLDPEALRAVMNRYFKEIRATIERHGGTVEKFIGDAVMAVFGIPRVHEDDALRAVRAAAEIRERLPSVAEAVGMAVRFRTGVNTGMVFTGEGESLAVGDAVNVAARLEQAAAPGEILLGPETYQLVRHGVAAEPAEPMILKGKAEPVSAYRLISVGEESTVDRPRSRRRSTVVLAADARAAHGMVGREAELATAVAVFDEAARDGEPRLLTVIGEAGIGKSRLAQELVDRLAARATVLVGRCLSYGEGIAFWPLREALTQAAGGETQEAIRGLLSHSEDADLAAHVIAVTLGLATGEPVHEQVPWAFQRLFEAPRKRGAVLLVIEDAHWAEDPLLDLLEDLVDQIAAPALVLCLARPELLDRRPHWGGPQSRMRSMSLDRLSAEDARRLLNAQLGDRRLTEADAARILDAAEGNPLFVEQLEAMTAEDPSNGGQQEIPVTIQSLLAARLDRLNAGERALIERAAMIGREFEREAVIDLLPPALRPSAAQHLGGLIQRGLVHPDRRTLAGHQLLSFHHILIRDVAYQATPKSLRSRLHAEFADWLDRHADVGDEFVGHHLEQSFDYSRELGDTGPEAIAVGTRARDRFAAAGRRALARGDTVSAASLLRRAAGLCDTTGSDQPQLLLDLGAALHDNFRFEDAESAFRRALAQARESGDESLAARAQIQLSFQRTIVDPSVPVDEMLSVAERAVEVFNRVGDNGGIASAWRLVGLMHWIRSRAAAMEEVLERALAQAERAGDARMASWARGYLARATVTGPRPVKDGIRRCQEILARAGSDVVLNAVAEMMLAMLEAMDGRFDDSRRHAASSTRRLEDVGLTVTAGAFQMYAAFIELLAGTPANVEAGVRDAYALLERVGENHRRATMAALLARLAYEQGRLGEAESYCRISEELASPEDVGTQVIWRGTHAQLLARAGETELAESLADRAVQLAGETDYLMLQGDALCDRAEVRAAIGRVQGAASDLEHAIEVFEQKGIRVSADAARRRLGTLRSTAALEPRIAAPAETGRARAARTLP